jgi:hypothetical protein
VLARDGIGVAGKHRLVLAERALDARTAVGQETVQEVDDSGGFFALSHLGSHGAWMEQWVV